jgi:hypothetical protein
VKSNVPVAQATMQEAVLPERVQEEPGQLVRATKGRPARAQCGCRARVDGVLRRARFTGGACRSGGYRRRPLTGGERLMFDYAINGRSPNQWNAGHPRRGPTGLKFVGRGVDLVAQGHSPRLRIRFAQGHRRPDAHGDLTDSFVLS